MDIFAKNGYNMNTMSSKNRKKQKDRQMTFRMLTLITQFGINMLVPIFLCFFAGRFLDQKLGTSYLMIVFFFVGALAGFRNIYIFARKMTDGTEDDSPHQKNKNDDQKNS